MLCLQFNQCKGCELCIEVCPNNVLEKSKQKNKNSQYPPAIKNGFECNLCKTCELICPDFSIYVTKINGVSNNDM
ncbi:MAG: 4Fe-4S dicluster domain-containing protein [Candidatus Lokiarchaeota archaeon]|nr:4Fe-4S dicluster domain-containing protein [Candidatus Lokiarchaeota archaeon]